jgi:hypothetical protein
VSVSNVLPDAAEAVLLYPGEPLTAQIRDWSQQHPECRVWVCDSQSLPEIRRAVENASAVVVDATEDHARAIDAMLQAVAQRGEVAVAVYTEQMHEGLELFVRSRGVLLLLGPLTHEEWEGFWQPRLAAPSQDRPATIPLHRATPGGRLPKAA